MKHNPTEAEHGLKDEIILSDSAVRHITPGYITDEEMFQALENAGMQVRDIYAELGARMAKEAFDTGLPVSIERAAKHIIEILFDRYKRELLKTTAHRTPVTSRR